MNLQIKNNDYAAINFFDGCRINIYTEGAVYDVHWYFNNNFFGNMQLGPSTWGSYNVTEFGIWTLKFYENNNLVKEYVNTLENKDCLLITSFTGTSQVGKKKDISHMVSYANKVVEEYKCNLKVYFPKTWEYDFSSYNFSPLRLNDNIENFYFGITKEF